MRLAFNCMQSALLLKGRLPSYEMLFNAFHVAVLHAELADAQCSKSSNMLCILLSQRL